MLKVHDPKKVLDCIIRYKEENDGVSPSIREISTYCDISSLSVTRYLLGKLEESGLIEMEYGESRSIRVIGGKWTYEPGHIPLPPPPIPFEVY